jgi:glucuronyl/N-acetylglucosaminyl transferase EXT1
MIFCYFVLLIFNFDRFLEALKAGCIPVLLSNGWVLPFYEVLNWDLAVVWGDEQAITQVVFLLVVTLYIYKLILFYVQIPSMLRDIPVKKIIEMRKYSIMFYNQYFISIKRIVHTSLEVCFSKKKKKIFQILFLFSFKRLFMIG